MRQNLLISLYMARRFLLNAAVIFAGLLVIIYIFDTVELIRRLSKNDVLSFNLAFLLGLYKLPEVGLQLLPFAVFFGSVYTFWSMTRSHELVVMRASGISAWQFLAPLIITGIFVAIFKITALNPIGSILLQKFETLEAQYLSKGRSKIDLSETGLWLKQPEETSTIIIHAPKVKLPEWSFKQLMVLYFDNSYRLKRRVDADKAKIERNDLVLANAMLHTPGEVESQKLDELVIDIDLSVKDIEQRFSTPRTVSFWKMRDYIKLIEEAGLPANPMKVFYYKLLAEPILYIALILLAAGIALRPPRANRKTVLLTGVIGIPFVIFFLGDLLQAFGISERLPLIMAAFSPALISMMAGVWAILHLEDG